MSLGTDYAPGALRFLSIPVSRPSESNLTVNNALPPGSYAAYLAACAAEIAGNTGWRKGEAYFNILADIRPDIAESLSGSVLDCYESDAYLPEFIEKVKASW